MPDQSHKQTPYDQFNFEIPQKFPEQGVSAAAANSIVNSETWTDANPVLNLVLAGLANKWNWREARKKAGKDSTRPNMVTGGNVQIVWEKSLRYFDVEPRIVPLKPGNYRLTAEHLNNYVDEKTICVVQRHCKA